jgi:chromosome segregation ATPase
MEMKIENLESELQSKNQEIKEHKAGIQSAGVLFKELKSKLKEKDKELNGVRAQLCNEEDFSSIKSLLESQKDSIIQSCMEMFDNNEESPVVIKVGMEMNGRKMVSEIAIHKEEIADFKSQSDVIRSEIGQKDLDLGKRQREVEDLKLELQLKDKKIEEQQVDVETIMQNLRTSCLEIETLKAQLEQERQNSRTILKNFGNCSEVENVIRSGIELKDLVADLGKMQKEVEDLRAELQLKDKKIEDQKAEIDTISLASKESKLHQDQLNQTLSQMLSHKYSEIEILRARDSDSEVENDIRPEVGQKEVKLEEMQKKVENLEKELQLKNKEIEDQQVEIDTISVASMEFKYFKAEVEQERQQQMQNSRTILQNLGMRCSEIEFMKTQLEQERQNSVTVLQNFGILNQNFEIMKAQLHQERQNFGILNQNFELLKAQFGQEAQKDLEGDLRKMQKEVEDLKTELRLKDKKIEEQQVDIETIMEYYNSHVLDD